MIVWDHAIRYLQDTGGISTWWRQHCFNVEPLVHSRIAHISYPSNIEPLQGRLDISRTFSSEQIPGRAWFLSRVHCPIGSTLFHSSYFRVPNPGPRYILTYHDASMPRMRGIRGRMHRWLQERCLRRADLIHCISLHAQKELLSEFPWIPHERLRVIHHGFSPLPSSRTAVSLPTHRPFVLFVGKREGYKQGHVAIRAISGLADIDLVLVGGGPLNDSELAWINSLQIQHRIHALGHVSDTHLQSLYCQATALWYPSLNEGFGFPVLEAAAAGCPVIACAGHGVEEIAGSYAMLHPAPSSEWVCQATRRAMNTSRAEWSCRGAVLIKRFMWESYASKMAALYQELGA
jgi:glycosyltransferase involved in cell wall biosynthesis